MRRSLGPRTIDYTPFSDYQKEFATSDDEFLGLFTGYGGGKTHSLVMKMFELMSINRGLAGGLLCPTIKMYKRDVLPTMYEIAQSNDVLFRYNKSESSWIFPETGATVFVFHSEDDGASIRGPNLAWGAANEITLCSQMAWRAFLARVRHGKATRPQKIFSGTPEGFNWVYEDLVEKQKKNTRIIFGSAVENPYLHGSYFDTLRDQYDPMMQKQYIDGQFVNLKGNRAAWAFDRKKHTRKGVTRIKELPVVVMLDFNVSPMAATLANVVKGVHPTTGERMHKIRCFKSMRLEGSNTEAFCRALKAELWTEWDGQRKLGEAEIYPDPAGNARTTKSNYSDFDILRREGFTNLKYLTVISVKDALNSMNNLFSKDLIELDVDECRDTIADLEQCVLKDGDGFEIDKKNPKRTHWLDGMKNFALYEYPIRRPTSRQEKFR